jgi:hypothetical protein
MHEEGRADHELIDEHERDRFAGTSAGTSAGTQTTDDDRFADSSTASQAAGDDRPMHEPNTEYEQGRIDERRFEREEDTERPDVRRS